MSFGKLGHTEQNCSHTFIFCIMKVCCLMTVVAQEVLGQPPSANDILKDTTQSQTCIIPVQIIHTENLFSRTERSSIQMPTPTIWKRSLVTTLKTSWNQFKTSVIHFLVLMQFVLIISRSITTSNRWGFLELSTLESGLHLNNMAQNKAKKFLYCNLQTTPLHTQYSVVLK